MTPCRLIAKSLSKCQLIMSMQEVTGCACMHVCYAWVYQEPIRMVHVLDGKKVLCVYGHLYDGELGGQKTMTV